MPQVISDGASLKLVSQTPEATPKGAVHMATAETESYGEFQVFPLVNLR